jgi:predicted PurR-regulated permease PerM
MSDADPVESDPVAEGMPGWVPDAIKATRWPLVFALVAAGILLLTFTWLVGQLGNFLTMIGIALFLSFALEPAVDYLATRGWKRGTATGLIFVILFGAIVLLVALIVPAVISGFNQLVQNAPALVDRLSNWLRPLGIKLSTDELIQKLQENAQQVISSATNVAGTVFGIASSLIGGLFRWATIALFTFYFVADGPRFRRALLSRMRPDRQERVLFVWEQAIRQTGGYFYSRLLLAVINGAGMYATLRITNVPFAAPLAIFEGIVAEFIPIVGTYIGGAVPVLVALLYDPVDALIVVIWIVVYQQIENYFLSPRLTARTMSLPAPVAFAAALIGGALGGILFAFLALPAAGVILAAIRTYGRYYEVVEDDATVEPALAPEKTTKSRSPRSGWFRRRKQDPAKPPDGPKQDPARPLDGPPSGDRSGEPRRPVRGACLMISAVIGLS